MGERGTTVTMIQVTHIGRIWINLVQQRQLLATDHFAVPSGVHRAIARELDGEDLLCLARWTWKVQRSAAASGVKGEC